jgi:hypothetical protein
MALLVYISLKSDPARGERRSGVGRREKVVSALSARRKTKKFSSSRPVEIVCSQLKQKTAAFLAAHDLANYLTFPFKRATSGGSAPRSAHMAQLANSSINSP